MLKNIFDPTPSMAKIILKRYCFQYSKKIERHADQLCKVNMLEKSFRLYTSNQKTKNINYAQVRVR